MPTQPEAECIVCRKIIQKKRMRFHMSNHARIEKASQKLELLTPQILELRRQGYSLAKISSVVGVSYTYVWRTLQKSPVESYKEEPKPEPEPETIAPKAVVHDVEPSENENFWEIPDQYFEKTVPTEMLEILSEIRFTLTKLEEMMLSVFVGGEQIQKPEYFPGKTISDSHAENNPVILTEPVKKTAWTEWQRKIGLGLLVIGAAILVLAFMGAKLW